MTNNVRDNLRDMLLKREGLQKEQSEKDTAVSLMYHKMESMDVAGMKASECKKFMLEFQKLLWERREVKKELYWYNEFKIKIGKGTEKTETTLGDIVKIMGAVMKLRDTEETEEE